MSNHDLDEMLLASLKRTGENFFLFWPCVIVAAWAAEAYSLHWLNVAATVGLVVVLFFVCIPNIGRIAALHKRGMNLSSNTKKHLVLADIGAVFTCAAIASIWTGYGIAWVEAAIAFGIAFINSLTSTNGDAAEDLPEDPALGVIRAMQDRLAHEQSEELYDDYGNPRPPYLTIENYKKLGFKCRSCSWWGIGSELEMGEVFDSLFEVECPKCHTYLGAIGFPLIEVQKGQDTSKGFVPEDDAVSVSGPESFSRSPTHDIEKKASEQPRRPNCRILDIPD
jgi:hypothetical protein